MLQALALQSIVYVLRKNTLLDIDLIPSIYIKSAMWRITLLLLVILYESTGTNHTDIDSRGLDDLKQMPNAFDYDTIVNALSDFNWREEDAKLINFTKTSDTSDCSYVDEIIKTNYATGYMEIVVSPDLHHKLFSLKYSQYVRIIFRVPYQSGDMIRLYKGTVTTGKPASQTVLKPSKLHHIDTNVQYDSGAEYTAVYVRKNGKIVVTTYFNNIKPSWMWCMKDIIGDRPLGKLFFPGTHDSGSYLVPDRWNGVIGELIKNLLFTQESTVLSQLIQGARSLDLRMGKYNTKIKFYINHNKFKIVSFKVVLDQIKEFLKSYPNEIILLDFHQFPVGYKTLSDHQELVSFLMMELGDLIYWYPFSASWSVTPNDIWKTKGRLIIAYNDNTIPDMYGFYPGVNQIWPNTDDLSAFVTFMDKNLPTNCGLAIYEMTNAMAQMTPTFSGIILKYRSGGVRSTASLTNSLVTINFLIGNWGNAAQIVAVDFLDTTGIVTAAIKQNALRAEKNHICY